MPNADLVLEGGGVKGTSAVGIVEFGVDEETRAALVANGERAARFLATWDWEQYLRECT